jgi:predicted nucleic acid-binding Zn ribbon protein
VSSNWRPLPSEDGVPPKRVGEVLDRITQSLGVGRASTLPKVFSAWDDLVGPQVAAHARPRSLRDGVLAVAVDQPAWATQLRYLEADLLRRIADVVGEGVVTRVEVRVAPPG